MIITFDSVHGAHLERDIAPPMKLCATVPVRVDGQGWTGVAVYVSLSPFSDRTDLDAGLLIPAIVSFLGESKIATSPEGAQLEPDLCRHGKLFCEFCDVEFIAEITAARTTHHDRGCTCRQCATLRRDMKREAAKREAAL